jgi:hypothetical protein
MAEETNEMEFDSLSARARDLGYFVGRHVKYDPLMSGGDLYLMERSYDERKRMPTLRKYQTSEQLWEFFAEQDRAS